VNFLFTNSARVWGGNEKWTHLAAHALAENHKVILAYRDHEIGRRFSIPKIKLPFTSEIGPVTLFRLVKIIREHRIDVIIPTKRKDFTLAGIASLITGTVNILRLGIERDLKNKILNNIVYNKWADGIIVNASIVMETLLRSSFMKREKIRVVHNGLDTQALDTTSAMKLRLNKKFSFIISSMGRITPVKRVDILVESFKNFLTVTNAHDALLVIIGDGESLPSIRRQIIESGITEQVIITGYIDNPYPYIHESDIFIITSVKEGISNSMLEAMYLGSLVISTPAGGALEVLRHGENGFVIDFNDVSSLTTLLVDIYSHPEIKDEIVPRARETVVEKFRIERMISDIEEFVREVCNRKGVVHR
jgi:glycosyltransferase involved in cell wall biosynthesis